MNARTYYLQEFGSHRAAADALNVTADTTDIQIETLAFHELEALYDLGHRSMQGMVGFLCLLRSEAKAERQDRQEEQEREAYEASEDCFNDWARDVGGRGGGL